MTKDLKDYLGYHIGDIITLSDIQTQEEYKKTEVDFIVTEVRTYKESSGFFIYTGYIASYKPDPEHNHQIMLMIRNIGDSFDLRVFFLNSEGNSVDFESLFSPDKDDLIDRFNATLHFDDSEDLEVTWDRQNTSFFGIETTSTKIGGIDQKNIEEYFTNDETRGNPYCFIEWTGDKAEGFLEIWYGCEIRYEDVELLHPNKL